MDWIPRWISPSYMTEYKAQLTRIYNLAQELHDYVDVRPWVEPSVRSRVETWKWSIQQRRDEADTLTTVASELFGRASAAAATSERDIERMLTRLKDRETHMLTAGIILHKKEQILEVTETELVALPNTPTAKLVKDGKEYTIHIDNSSLIGGGGFGYVFNGVCDLGRIAAKCPHDQDREITPEARQKIFELEAEVWKVLRGHDHILEFYGVTTFMNSTFLISPYMKNGSVRKYLQENKDSDLCRVKITRDVANALSFMHEKGIVHGDMKADNVLLDDRLNALICDFGMAKLPGTNTASTLKWVGSSNWKSPELWHNYDSTVLAPKTTASDTYAFGLTVYEILSGEIPFGDLQDFLSLRRAHLNGVRPRREPSSSANGWSYSEVWDIAVLCWAQKAGDRPAMVTVYDALVKAAESAARFSAARPVVEAVQGGIIAGEPFPVSSDFTDADPGEVTPTNQHFTNIAGISAESSNSQSNVDTPTVEVYVKSMPLDAIPAAGLATTEQLLHASAKFRPFRSNMSPVAGLAMFRELAGFPETHWALRRQASQGFSGRVTKPTDVD